MNKSSDNSKSFKKQFLDFLKVFGIVLIIYIVFYASRQPNLSLFKAKQTFKLISSTSNELFDADLIEYAKTKKINLTIDHYGDLEMIDILNSDENDYDGVWISNSIWLYMLENTSLVKNSKSIAINPVVMGVTLDKAKELGFTNGNVTNKDILNAISEKKLNYVMTSVVKTNTGATAYLGFLNSLAGNPEVLTSEMLKNEELVSNMKKFFSGVKRESGDESYLSELFLNGEYDAAINYESSLIALNQELTMANKEPLYLLYPVDGVAINDMPFGYVDRKQNKEDDFNILLDFLRSDETSSKLESKGYRTWYGGVNDSAPSSVFNKDWGINTNNYLMPLKYPSKAVITEAFNLYADVLRKPAHIVFCLDTSGSMSSNHGMTSLKDSLTYLFTRETSSKDRIQFSKNDKISIVTFNNKVRLVSRTYNGEEEKELLKLVNYLSTGGGTNIYDSSIESLTLLEDTSDDYTKTIVLMTDGLSNSGSFVQLSNYYNRNGLDIPIYSIMFGNSNEDQLNDIAKLTNGKVFDGKDGLRQAFIEVRSYS